VEVGLIVPRPAWPARRSSRHWGRGCCWRGWEASRARRAR